MSALPLANDARIVQKANLIRESGAAYFWRRLRPLGIFILIALCSALGSVHAQSPQHEAVQAALRALLPPEAVVDTVTIDGQRVRASGSSPSNAKVSQFMRSIEESADFEAVELEQISQSGNRMHYELNAKLMCNGSSGPGHPNLCDVRSAKPAAINKCEVKGRTIYQQAPCPGASRSNPPNPQRPPTHSANNLERSNPKLPSSPESYLSQATQLRQAQDRLWQPASGRLGNLRHVQISAKDCVVRVVSGSENRVFPGARAVVVVEKSRVLDDDPNQIPIPRDVILSSDNVRACVGLGSCGISVTRVTEQPSVGSNPAVCFTLQIATAQDLLIGGDGLDILIDHVQQPVLRLGINPSSQSRVWIEKASVGLLSIKANAAIKVGGNGNVDFIQADSSNSASTMYLHEFNANSVGVSTTTTGTQWSIHIDDDSTAGYYQPARAPGRIAENYSIEVDGPINRLEVPAGSVSPRPLSDATRLRARTLRQEVLDRAGPAPTLPKAEIPSVSANEIAKQLPRDAKQTLADVAGRYLPSSIRITSIALWKSGGRIEGMAPDANTARAAVKRLEQSGEFTLVRIGVVEPRAAGVFFSALVSFACAAPGAVSSCPAEDPDTPGAYSDAQVRAELIAVLGAGVTIRELRIDANTVNLKASAPDVLTANTALDRIRQHSGLLRLSTSGVKSGREGADTEFQATLQFICSTPPKPDGVCSPPDPH